jgi:hypothetical protein
MTDHLGRVAGERPQAQAGLSSVGVGAEEKATPVDPRIVAGRLRTEKLCKFSVKELALTAIEQFRDGRIPFEMICDGELVKGQLFCPYPVKLNPHFEENELFGFQWLQKIGYLPSRAVIEKIMAATDENSREAAHKIRTLQKTNITLLAALTLPDADEGGLRLAVMVDAWLFVTDNEFDNKNSPFSKDPALMQQVFEAFKDSFEGRESETPSIVPECLRDRVAALIRGIGDIGNAFRIYRPHHIDRIAFGLERYRLGNENESRSRAAAMAKSSSEAQVNSVEPPKKNPSIRALVQKRDNAGAVELVLEAAEAVESILSRDIYRAGLWQQFRELVVFHICGANDIPSREKEKTAGLLENLMIHYENLHHLTPQKAANAVATELDSVISELEEIEKAICKQAAQQKLPAQIMMEIDRKLAVMKTWLAGHILWEAISFEGRHEKLPCIDPQLCEALRNR